MSMSGRRFVRVAMWRRLRWPGRISAGEDVALTARLVEAGQLMGIEVVDHLVLADARYCSFKEMGRL